MLSAAKMDDSFPAHWESLPTSKICDADWLMANSSVSFFGSCPSRDIKHVFIQSANAILQKENFARKETLRRAISPVKFRHAANGA